MGNWYRVTKCINGRLYDYWQRTYRVGKSVKTENKYIGPTSNGPSSSGVHASSISSPAPAMSQYELTLQQHHVLLRNMQATPPEPELPEPEPRYKRLELSQEEWREIRAAERERKKEFDAGMKRQAAQVRAAKRKSRGTGAINPFLGQAITGKKK